MSSRRRIAGRATAVALLTLGLTVAVNVRPARAFLTIDWFSCRAETVPNGEGGIRRTGRQICSLSPPGGIVFRRDPEDPEDRACREKKKKAKKALEEAKKRLSNSTCAAALNGPAGTALDTVNSVLAKPDGYNACAGEPPKENVAAQAAKSLGPNTDIRFFTPFYGSFAAHCGAGAPRFQVLMSDGSFSFIGGCVHGTATPDTPGTGWTRVRFNPQDGTQAFPPVPVNATISSISLAFDEGPDNDPNGSPEIVLDNIFINGKFATKP